MVDDADCCTEHDVGLVLDDALAEGEGVAVVVDAGADVAEGDGAGTKDAVLEGAGEEDGDTAAPSAAESDVIVVRPIAVLHSR